MEIKKIVDEFHPVTLHVIDDGIQKLTPAPIVKEYDFNYENLISDEYWEKNAYNLVCKAMSDDERGKMSGYYGGPMVDHFTKICSDDKSAEACTMLNKGLDVYYKMDGRYKEDCIKAIPSYSDAYIFPAMLPQYGK